jgi:hypothetical protein
VQTGTSGTEILANYLEGTYKYCGKCEPERRRYVVTAPVDNSDARGIPNLGLYTVHCRRVSYSKHKRQALHRCEMDSQYVCAGVGVAVSRHGWEEGNGFSSIRNSQLQLTRGWQGRGQRQIEQYTEAPGLTCTSSSTRLMIMLMLAPVACVSNTPTAGDPEPLCASLLTFCKSQHDI